MKINLFHQLSPVLNRVILALISCYPSLMRYMNLLMLGWKSEVSFFIYKLTQNGILGNLLNLLQHFLNERKQCVVLSRQVFTWEKINVRVPQGSILGPLFFIYINNLTVGLTTNAKLFADYTSLFSVVHDTQTSVIDLSKDLEIINNWAYQWNTNFNPDPTKQA